MPPLAPADHEPVLTKTSHNAFTTTNLQQLLTRRGVTEVVITGLRTEQCCETTGRLASDLGYRVTFVLDGTATNPIPDPAAAAGQSVDEMLADLRTLSLTRSWTGRATRSPAGSRPCARSPTCSGGTKPRQANLTRSCLPSRSCWLRSCTCSTWPARPRCSPPRPMTAPAPPAPRRSEPAPPGSASRGRRDGGERLRGRLGAGRCRAARWPPLHDAPRDRRRPGRPLSARAGGQGRAVRDRRARRHVGRDRQRDRPCAARDRGPARPGRRRPGGQVHGGLRPAQRRRAADQRHAAAPRAP